MNIKVRDGLFFCICFTLIFNNIPKILQMNFLGGSVLGGKLVFYPIFLGIIYTIYCHVKYKNIFVYHDRFKLFISMYIAVMFLSLALGLYTYPYYNLILLGPVDQIEKMPVMLHYLKMINIQVSEQSLLMVWMLGRVVKGLFFEVIYTFGGAYLVFCWYYNNWQTAFCYVRRAVIGPICVLLLYCCIEIPHLANVEWATQILMIINPFIHIIKENNTWWPPLLWNGHQLRSIFAEPSYFGIYSAFAMPFLWYSLYISSRKKTIGWYSLIIVSFSFCLFLTKSRTAVALLFGELFFLAVYTIYLRYKVSTIRFCFVVSCIGIAFFSANYFISHVETIYHEKNSVIGAYLEDNVASLASENKRSNQARYSIIKTNFYIGLDHPLLGVGSSLRSAYVKDYLPDDGKNNEEIQMWLNNQQEQGILKFGIPNLSEYTKRFAETGVLGILMFLIMPFILAILLLKNIIKKRSSYLQVCPFVFFFISLTGVVASGLGDSINITYCYWILLGVGYAMCLGGQEKEQHS
jgi:hypothetical protein